MDFPKRYEPKQIEKYWYKFWESQGYFTPNLKSQKPRFCIVIPPPNITGVLHMGHALNSTLQDIIIRFKKLQGYETLWLPGVDHASIATHNQIEKLLAKQGKTRFDIGREEFLKLAWEWKEKHANIILEQLKSLGAACDWTRTRFTMDAKLSRAVREAFVQYYEKGLIYKAYYIINWCPRCHTSISDLEVKYKETATKLWYIKYPLKPDNKEPIAKDYIVVATTRPETMLGDTAVAVNPNDERYKSLIGKEVLLPLANRIIPIIGETTVDVEFGTGAVKVTPAHDPVDFEIGNRHKLEFVKIIDEDAKITDKAPLKYQGLSREKARELIVADLSAQGYLEKVEDYTHRVGTCVRCETLIEPLVSLQWFLKTKPLAEPAIKKVEDQSIRFYPERWTKVYLDWMYNIRDWCISRQLWWGHRIPAFYCDDCNNLMVTREDPKECDRCHSKNIRQDEDILDTWFSSALWPFSTLGWPDDTEDLRQFYPTNLLSTDPDIIFLWVARMIMSGLEFIKDIPFRDVYIHSTVLAETGERMSRSKGIGVDPLLLIDKYGACALRFTLAYLETESQSYRFWEKKVELGRNFANKIWNAGRLISMYLEISEAVKNLDESYSLTSLWSVIQNPIDIWIFTKYIKTVETVTSALERYAYAQAASALYTFFWDDFCDWYLETCKIRLKDKETIILAVLRKLFQEILILLHPFMPFLTEELWHRFNFQPGSSILDAAWPEIDDTTKQTLAKQSDAIRFFDALQDLIKGIRNIRAEMNIANDKKVICLINTSDKALREYLLSEIPSKIIKELGRVSKIEPSEDRPAQSSVIIMKDLEVYIPLTGLINFEKERKRLENELQTVQRELDKINSLLTNDDFLTKAKPLVVERERERKLKYEDKIKRLRAAIASLV
ncbi:MAG: valine--tRNA ligase [candidate division WOR-3 bacterium]|nr:valine--tRNA ligase [candidate division WOR-3 bacterium]